MQNEIYIQLLELYTKDIEDQLRILYAAISLQAELEHHRQTKSPAPPPLPPAINTWYGNCPTCGLKLDTTMGYCCSNPKCPTGLGPVYS